MQSLVSGIIHGDGTGSAIGQLAWICSANSGHLRLRARCGFGAAGPPANLPSVALETTADGAWVPLVDFAELEPGVELHADVQLPPRGDLRGVWRFRPDGTSRHWTISVVALDNDDMNTL